MIAVSPAMFIGLNFGFVYGHLNLEIIIKNDDGIDIKTGSRDEFIVLTVNYTVYHIFKFSRISVNNRHRNAIKHNRLNYLYCTVMVFAVNCDTAAFSCKLIAFGNSEIESLGIFSFGYFFDKCSIELKAFSLVGRYEQIIYGCILC